MHARAWNESRAASQTSWRGPRGRDMNTLAVPTPARAASWSWAYGTAGSWTLHVHIHVRWINDAGLASAMHAQHERRLRVGAYLVAAQRQKTCLDRRCGHVPSRRGANLSGLNERLALRGKRDLVRRHRVVGAIALSFSGHFRSRHSFGDIPMARDPATWPPTEASTAERANRLCLRRALIVHGFSRALLPATSASADRPARAIAFVCSPTPERTSAWPRFR